MPYTYNQYSAEVVLCIEEEDLNLEVDEGGFVSVCVSVIHGSCERDVVVTLETEAGTAIEGLFHA